MFLKQIPVTVAGKEVVLHELSALQYIEYLEYAAAHESSQDDPAPGGLGAMAEAERHNIALNAMLACMGMSPTECCEPTAERDERHRLLMATRTAQQLADMANAVWRASGLVMKEEAGNESAALESAGDTGAGKSSGMK
ncbi:hypothetical protein K6R34_002828 [Salmonella enterica]|nr:hypothetical protein [Salmonella enterica]EHZ8201932.1 hypothetical protein [Salmonella enterica]